jgi:hypothetical protein
MLDEADAIYDQRINALRLARTTGQLLPRDLPAHWLDQLFAPETQVAQGARIAPAIGLAAATPRAALRLDTRLNPQLLDLPSVASDTSRSEARW